MLDVIAMSSILFTGDLYVYSQPLVKQGLFGVSILII